ncbi:MAG: hypothetical protein NW201_13480 [Gemmatimonadales bacterium]|nr:hypothetical protein [Gemmatimonadales bacterium]
MAWLVRIASERTRTKGWQARIPFGEVVPGTRSRRFRSKLFSDRAHGGSRKAKAAAEAWIAAELRRGRKR